MSAEQLDDNGYDGPAQLVIGTPGTSSTVDVRATLRGMFQPIDGRYHWYGRLTQSDEMNARVESGSSVVLRTPHGESNGRLSDIDTWGRYRISGTGRPPFPSE